MKNVALVGAGASFAGFSAGVIIATKSAIDFESQMANVGTLLDGDVKAKLVSMGEEVKKFLWIQEYLAKI